MSAAPLADGATVRVHRSQSTRHPSSSHSPSYRPSADHPQAPRRDFDPTSAAQPNTRRSASRDRPNAQYPVRSESVRTGHSRPDRRYPSVDASSSHPHPTNGMVADHPASRSAAPQQRKRTYIQCSTGTWALGKTIGQGSMGKVKLAKNQDTGEQVAVKIVPRQSTDEHKTAAERDRADHSKEVRTAREAAIVSLVQHPYICGMRDVYKTNYHWYMLFEYVNGGQMLDYIISHGRLKEKGARKFARQIASALDYCHRNSIVHRDLKIENILISKTGDIKIIDFGLSNLFSPSDHLKTFCGSLYFAAPELLQAKQYTGPEVDIWSFGVVLYVLVCGKVPFDDQSMPQLHAKIKKGNAEYPPWLTSECKNLISRMLVTDPRQRASLAEIMNHPWMTKGFSGPPENHLGHREPITLPLNAEVVQKMTGFDFGSPEYITAQLTKIIESDRYQKAVRLAAQKHAHAPDSDRGRGLLGFYKRRNSATSRDTLFSPSSDAIPLGEDPINAFAPMLSVYYLVREKMERDSQVEKPGAVALPTSPNEKTPMADISAPPAAYTNSAAYEMRGETTGGRTRPRARTRGEDDIAPQLPEKRVEPPTPVPVQQAELHPPKKESTAGAILRRISTRRRKPEPSTVEHRPMPPAVAITSPSDTGPVGPSIRKSFSTRQPRLPEPPSSASLNTGNKPPELLTPPGNESSGFPRRFMSLRRAASVDRRRLTRRTGSEAYPEPPATSGSDGSSSKQKVPDVPTSSHDNRQEGVAMRTKSLGHARKESIQKRRAMREGAAREQDVREETEAEVAESRAEPTTDHEGGEESIKPVYLKGLFSVSTTSSKPLPFIRNDIIRVLKQLGVQYTEIKGGFRCRHTPSLKELNDPNSPLSPGLQAGAERSHRRKISFNSFKPDEALRSPKTPRNGRGTDGSPAISDTDSESALDDRRGPRPPRSNMTRDAGATSTHVRDEISRDMTVDFEIFIVKVPLLTFHGIQFKKVEGNIMQYKNLAQEILKGLKL